MTKACSKCNGEMYQRPCGRWRCRPCHNAATNARGQAARRAAGIAERQAFATESERQQHKRDWNAAYRAANRERIREYKAQYRETHRDTIAVGQRAYYINNADTIKARAAAWREAHPERFRAALRRWVAEHREYRRDYERNYLAANVDRVRARRKAYYERTKETRAPAERQRRRDWWLANKDRWTVYRQNRRARERATGGRLSAGLVSELMARQAGFCVACRSALSARWRHLDHIIPLALGGKHEDANMQLLCPPCNLSKAARDPIEFMQSRGFLL